MYMDTQTWGINHGWMSSDSPGYPEYPRYTWILRHEGSIMGGRLRIVRDTLSILGVRGYSDTGSSHGWTSSDSLGHSWYP